MDRHKIAILVSGAGTNAVNIIEYFEKNSVADVTLVVSNKTDALAVEKAQNKGVKTIVFNNETFKKNGEVLDYLRSESIDFIVLAGFLMKVPNDIIHAYPNKIVNLHPSLLPKFGGKGMYGNNVHRAVIKAQESESGISIHFVNEEYDEGAII
ncbi:MAG: formyltransferase family protein, partial [Flavobacteriales bacterium]